MRVLFVIESAYDIDTFALHTKNDYTAGLMRIGNERTGFARPVTTVTSENPEQVEEHLNRKKRSPMPQRMEP